MKLRVLQRIRQSMLTNDNETTAINLKKNKIKIILKLRNTVVYFCIIY